MVIYRKNMFSGVSFGCSGKAEFLRNRWTFKRSKEGCGPLAHLRIQTSSLITKQTNASVSSTQYDSTPHFKLEITKLQIWSFQRFFAVHLHEVLPQKACSLWDLRSTGLSHWHLLLVPCLHLCSMHASISKLCPQKCCDMIHSGLPYLTLLQYIFWKHRRRHPWGVKEGEMFDLEQHENLGTSIWGPEQRHKLIQNLLEVFSGEHSLIQLKNWSHASCWLCLRYFQQEEIFQVTTHHFLTTCGKGKLSPYFGK